MFLSCLSGILTYASLTLERSRSLPSVPQDLSLVGFDGIASRYVTPPLTTVCQPMLEIGRSAMQMLLDLLEEKTIENLVFSTFLVKRGSSAM
jgi:LacI family transcriptional regulator/LacI family repressor for deo operon, udp, cdd, tsx, nupC, and nupG